MVPSSTQTRLLQAAAVFLWTSSAHCSSSSFIPEGYTYIGQHSVAPSSLQSRQYSSHNQLPSTGYVASLTLADLKSRPKAQQQSSADKEHDTLLVTREGHAYTKRLAIPSAQNQSGVIGLIAREDAPSTQQASSSQQRQLLQTTSGTSLNPTLACDGCPSTDTRTRVTDSTQYPYTAVGMVTRTQSSSISSEVVQCSGTLIGTGHVLTAGHCVVNTDSGEVISGMQFWPAYNGDDEPFQPMDVTRTRVLSRFANQTDVSTASLNYDFALLTLTSKAPNGTAALAIVAGVGEQSYNLVTAGYPGDKSPQGSMWTTTCNNVLFDFAGSDLEGCGDDCDNMVQHSCLTYEGQSGSGMWSDNNQTIHSIVTGAITLDNNEVLNVGIQMNAFVFNTIAGWYNEDASEPLPLTPAPPSAPAQHHNPSTNAAGSWVRDHIYTIVVPAVIGAIILLGLLCCLISCCRRCCARRKHIPMVGPQARVPPPYPVGPQGTYANQYAQYSNQPQRPPYPNQPPRIPPNASPFAQSFYNNGHPAHQRW